MNFLTILIVLSGCASNPSISSLTPQERERVSNIVIIESGEISKDSYTALGVVEGLACKRNLYASGTPSHEKALQGVKIRAARLRANAVLNLFCEENQEVERINKCRESIVCVGDAIFVNDPTVLPTAGGQGKTRLTRTISMGTGWVVEPGFIVTNQHVIKGATNIVGHWEDGKSTKLFVMADDPINDIVLLLPDPRAQLPRALPLAKKDAAIGEAVFTVGFPHAEILGSNAKVTSGIISAKSGLNYNPRVYQTTVQLHAGNSGGPLMSMRGEAVGIATSKLDTMRVFRFTGDLMEGINYAVKSHYIAELIASVREVSEFKQPDQQLRPFLNLKDAVIKVQKSVVLIEAK